MNFATRVLRNTLLDIPTTQASQSSTKKKKAKRQKRPLPEKQTIKHYFQPVPNATAAEAIPIVSTSSDKQTSSFSPALTNLASWYSIP